MTTKVTSRVIANQTVRELNLAPNSVGVAEIITGAIRTQHYGAQSIPSTAYGVGSVDNPALAAGAVTGVKIATKGLISANYGDASIPSTAYGVGSVNNTALAAGAVTGDKVATATLIGANYAAGSVGTAAIANGALVATHFNDGTIAPSRLIGGTAGAVMVANGSGVFQSLAPGGAGSILTSDGSNVSWAGTSSVVHAGIIVDYICSAPPPGWVVCNGNTIGKSGSGATERANDDCYALYTIVWNFVPGSSVIGGRGGSSDADWNAGKTVTLPDLRGRVTAGHNSSNASDTNLVPGNYFIGATGGAAVVQLTEDNIPTHTHQIAEYHVGNNQGADLTSSNQTCLSTGGLGSGNLYYSMEAGGGNANVGRSSSFGGGQSFSNMPPFYTSFKIIKL